MGPFPPDVLLGPAPGEDACAIEVPGGVLVVATDPITFTGSEVGRLAVIVNANDVAVMGVRPRWFLATVMLPLGSNESDVRALFASIAATIREVGATLVGGHTEVTAAVVKPVVVGQMIGLAEDGRFVSTGGVRVGDAIVQVGPAPVEGAAVLAREVADRLTEIQIDPDIVRAAARALDVPGISVVEAALAAAALGASALHDPTEGGIASGLHEMAAASGVALRVHGDRVLWFEPGIAVCRALGADPWSTLASGTLIAAFGPDEAGSAVASLSERGHHAAVVGVAEVGAGVSDSEGRVIEWPPRDEVARILSG
jgi:hydrogenase maturation factor